MYCKFNQKIVDCKQMQKFMLMVFATLSLVVLFTLCADIAQAFTKNTGASAGAGAIADEINKILISQLYTSMKWVVGIGSLVAIGLCFMFNMMKSIAFISIGALVFLDAETLATSVGCILT